MMPNPSPPPAPSPGPNKAIASLFAGAIVTIFAYLVNLFTHQTLPPEVIGALQTIIVTAVVYFVPHGGDA